MIHAAGSPNYPVCVATTLCGQVGTRFPHAWIERDGVRRSTLDLFGGEETAMAGPTARPGLGLRAGVDFRSFDNGVTWQTLTAGDDDATMRVRPDGFVTSR